jgi:hypothetical protein
MKSTNFWDVTPSSLAECDIGFVGATFLSANLSVPAGGTCPNRVGLRVIFARSLNIVTYGLVDWIYGHFD